MPIGAACLLCRLPTLPFACFFAPIPPVPFPSGEGEIFTLFRRGLRPRHPCTEPLAALIVPAQQVLRRLNPRGTGCPCRTGARGGLVLFAVRLPCRCGVRRGACPLCRLSALPLVCFLSPIPPTPFPAGRGRFFSFLMQGASPLASPRLNPRGTGYPCRLRPRRGAQGSLPRRHWLALPRGRGPSQTPPSRQRRIVPSPPVPPSPWLPALLMRSRFLSVLR